MKPLIGAIKSVVVGEGSPAVHRSRYIRVEVGDIGHILALFLWKRQRDHPCGSGSRSITVAFDLSFAVCLSAWSWKCHTSDRLGFLTSNATGEEKTTKAQYIPASQAA